MARKKIREYDSKRLLKEHLKRLANIDLQIHSVQVTQATDFTELTNKEPWLSSTRLVVKPDMLFGKRGKSGLVALNLDLAEVAEFVKVRLGVEVEMGGCKAPITTFIVEPFVPHDQEYYLSIVSERLGSTISFSECGGIEIEENWDKVKTIFLPTEKPMTLEACAPLIATLPLEVRGKIADFIMGVFTVFQDLDFSFIEMNPFALVNGEPYPLDMRGELDDTAAFKNFKKWGDIEFPLPFGRVMSPKKVQRKQQMAQETHHLQEEHFDVLTKSGLKTGISKPRGDVHRDGDYHRAVHVWIFAENTQELLLQRRSDCKDSWPGLWDISSAGHISAGDSSLVTARRELQEELGVILPKDAFEIIFIFLQECVINDGKFINNEFNDVYLVTTLDPIPLEAFTLQETEVSAVKYISYEKYRSVLAKEDPEYVPYDVNGQYGQLFDIIERRYKENAVARSLALQKQLRRFAPVTLNAELTGLMDADRDSLVLLVKAAKIMDEIFSLQVWCSNPVLRDWLKEHADASELDKLKWMYYVINKSPWSCLDEDVAFLTTADSAIKLLPEATRRVTGWKGLEYRAAFPMVKPPGANFYPPDMDKMEFESWKGSLTENQQKDATSFFNVIKRQSEFGLESPLSNDMVDKTNHMVSSAHDLYWVPFSQEYNPFLKRAAELLHKAGDMTSSPSLKRLLHSKASAFLSNDYYESDIAWMELDSKLDVTIGPYETYEDALFGYKATFEAFIGVRDDKATAQIKLFGDNLKILEQNLPMESAYKSEDVIAAPIRVIHLLYNSGDVKGPQTVAFNLPNDERIVNDRGTSMVILKNVSEAKFKYILQPIADVCITKEQQELVDFESFFTHTTCHECCHGIGPHTITLPNGQKSTVRLELQELHSALEEAKADIVGLWALRFLINQDLLPKSLLKSMYVSFLAGCFRSVRFGLNEAHGKGQAVQFNWLYDKGAFILHPDETFSVDFSKVEGAVESLSREILTIQAKGDKEAANVLLQKYSKMTQPLKVALQKLEDIQVPVDIAPIFPIANKILE